MLLFSGRSAPLEPGQEDPKWRSAIERALGSWESVVEWPDYISFLARLQKAVKNRPNPESRLPCAREIAEMLSRCLDPTLPTGVHQTALQAYKVVFQVLGTKALSESIYLWLPGLLPVVSFAAFSVKPLVLGLLKDDILNVASREIVRPLLLSCLPSMEEESGEFFDEVLGLVLALRDRINDDSFFWQCMMLSVMTSTEVRLGALAYFSRYLPTFTDPLSTEARIVTTPDPGLMLRAIQAGLRDSDVLVQRGFLDVLVRCLPLGCSIVQEHKRECEGLMSAAVASVLRRDMSLNRRLWTWLLGPDPESGDYSRQHYFAQFGLDILNKVLLQELPSSEALQEARAMLDRWEVGSAVVPSILVPILRKCGTSARQFVDAVEVNMIWKTLLDLGERNDVETALKLLNFLDSSDEEVAAEVPLVLLYFLATNGPPGIISELPKYLPPLAPPPKDFSTSRKPALEIRNYLETSVQSNSSDELAPACPYSPGEVTALLIDNAGSLATLQKILERTHANADKWVPQFLEAPTAELFKLLYKSLKQPQRLSVIDRLVGSIHVSLRDKGEQQVEKVRELWYLAEIGGFDAVTSAISRYLISEDVEQRAYVWSLLWVHSAERPDLIKMLAKPTLIFCELLDTGTGQNYAEGTIVRTGTSMQFARLLVGLVNQELESNPDCDVLDYLLSLVLLAMEIKEVKSAFLLCSDDFYEKLLSWIQKQNGVAGSKALKLIELANDNLIIRVGEVLLEKPPTLVAMEFFAKEMRKMLQLKTLLFWIIDGIDRLQREDEFVVWTRLLNAYIDAVTPAQVTSVALELVDELLNRLNSLDSSLLEVESSEIGDSSVVIQLCLLLERVTHATLRAWSEDQEESGAPRSFFSVETPSDRTQLERAKSTAIECLNRISKQCIKYWAWLERVRGSVSPGSTCLYATGRLKTRIRKLFAPFYQHLTKETLMCCVAHATTVNSGVRLVHMIEGTQLKNSTSVLLELLQANRTRLMADFFVAYCLSLELDVIEDIWPIIAGFLSDVHHKSTQYAQIILPMLALMSEIGDFRGRRRDFSDLFSKLLSSAVNELPADTLVKSEELTKALNATPGIISEPEKQGALLTKVMQTVVSPLFQMPQNMTVEALDMLKVLIDTCPTTRTWRTLVSDLLFDQKVFTLPIKLAPKFSEIVGLWAQADKERLSEFVGRIATFGSSNILFGWSGGQQLTDENLARLTFIMLSAETLPVSWTRIVAQLTGMWQGNAPFVCLFLRSLLLRKDALQMLPAFSFMSYKLQETLLSLKETDDELAIAAAKLLDLALTTGIDQFQPYEWLFVCDSGDAIHPANDGNRTGGLAEKLAQMPSQSISELPKGIEGVRRPLLPVNTTKSMLHAFWNQLSVTLFEANYALERVDWDYCREMLFEEIFGGSTN